MKEIIWIGIVCFLKLFPDFLMQKICYAILNSFVSAKNSKNKLKLLLEIDEKISWFIDSQAIIYEGGIHPKHRLTDYHTYFTDRIKPHDSVLDVGCGNGVLTHAISKAAMKVIGIDISPESISSAISNYSRVNIEYRVADINSKMPKEVISVIVMSNVLEHLEDRQQVLKSLLKTYDPRVLLIRVPMINRDWKVPMREELNLFQYSDSTHFVEYTYDSFINELKGANLAIEEYRINWGEIWAVACVIR